MPVQETPRSLWINSKGYVVRCVEDEVEKVGRGNYKEIHMPSKGVWTSLKAMMSHYVILSRIVSSSP